MKSRALLIASVAAIVVGLGSMVAVGATGGFDRSSTTSNACSVPSLPGSVVHVSLSNMGGMMNGGMTGGGGMMGNGSNGSGMMSLSADTAEVSAGTVSFVATNNGSIDHELVVLPLQGSRAVGTRSIGGDDKVNEDASLGEASKTCGEGAGDGIAPGSSSWVTLHLSPGRYELVCNIAGHYAAGMYAEFTVN